jgi:hypothetical protein
MGGGVTPPPTPLNLEGGTDSPTPMKKAAVGGGKADIAAMLANRMKKGTSPVPDEKGAASPIPAAAKQETPATTMAVPKPTELPCPPPLPTAWPPKPYIAPEKKKAPVEKKSESLNSSLPPLPPKADQPKKMVKKQIIISEPAKVLPEGYYLAASKADMVQPFEIVEAGVITQATIAELTQQFDDEDREYSFEFKFDDETNLNTSSHYNEESHYEFNLSSYEREYADMNIANKKSVHDLPVPSSFMSTVNRLKKAVSKREEQLQFQKDLDLRNYEVPRSSNASASYVTSSSSSAKKAPRNTIPEEFAFQTDQHFDNKRRTFRKESNQSDPSLLPLSDRVEENVVHQSIHRYGAVDRPTAYWLQSLRSTPTSQSSSNLGSPTTEDVNKHKVGRMHGLPTQTVLTNLDPSSVPNNPYSSGTLNEEYNNVTISEEYYRKNLRNCTPSSSPRFLSEEAIQRRNTTKEFKQSQNEQSQHYEKQFHKIKKEQLKEKALQTAKEVGVYKPHNRYRVHQRLVERYKNNPGVVGGLDLERVTQQAYENYYSSTSGASTPVSHQSYNEWENVTNQNYPSPHPNQARHPPQQRQPLANPHYSQQQQQQQSQVYSSSVHPHSRQQTKHSSYPKSPFPSQPRTPHSPMTMDDLLEEYD